MENSSRRLAGGYGSRVFPWLLVLFLVAVVVAQQRRAAMLRLEIDSCHGAQQAGTPAFEPIAPGKELPAFTARTTEGRELEVGARVGGPSLLLIYEPGCARCEAALPSWVQLFDELRARGSEAVVVGLSIADSYSTVQHARNLGLPFPVVPIPDPALVAAYGIVQVPIAAIVDGTGHVVTLWDSPLEAGARADALELLCAECLGSALSAQPVSDDHVGGGGE